MFCKYCGQKIDEDSIFCRFCGKKVISEYTGHSKPYPVYEDKNEFDSREELLMCAQKFCDKYRTGEKSYLYYREIIDKHIKNKDINILLDKDDFYELIHKTLKSWNMNQRGAKLKSIEEIKNSILSFKKEIIELYEYNIEELSEIELNDVLEKLKFLFINLKPMKSNRQIVGTSKLLHFLIPNLVMPIDGKFTMQFFYGHNKYRSEINAEFKDFEDIFIKFYKMIKKFNIQKKDVDNNSWKASVPKIIDDAIIGLLLK
jgi:hypothetical protein